MKLWIRRSHHPFWDSLSNQLRNEESRSCNTLNLCNQFDNDHKIYTTVIWLAGRTSYNEVTLVVQKTPPKQNIFFQSESSASMLLVPGSLCVHAHWSLGLTEFIKLPEDFRGVHRSFVLETTLTKYHIWSQIDEVGFGGWVKYPWFTGVLIDIMNKTLVTF